MKRRRRWSWAGILCALVMTAACGDARLVKLSACAPSDKLVPRCGAFWGITTPEPTTASLKRVEKALDTRFDFVYRFHDINDSIPDAAEERQVAAGKKLHLSIDARDFSDPDRTAVTWADVASGRYDTDLRSQGKGIASLKAPVWVTFEHEADQSAKEALGSAEEFKEAWRHVREVYTKAGAGNAVWVWVVTGYGPTIPRAANLWPGNDQVDWISWEAYNQSGCLRGEITTARYTSFAESMLVFYRWVRKNGAEFGIDATKPMMISEAGSVLYPDDAQKTADWYAEIPSVLRKYPQIKAVGLWNHTGSTELCDYRFDRAPAIGDSVAEAGRNSWLNPLGDDR